MSTAFLTDKYELTMIQAALMSGQAYKKATFELFARKLPKGRRYGVVAGMTRAIEAARDFRFTDEQIAYLENDPVFTPELVEFCKNYKFNGVIEGYAEGSLYFPYSPILTVKSTFAEGVILETVLLSILNHDSAVASAASRMFVAGEMRIPLIEMGSRRTDEAAAVHSARAAYIAGFTSTSNLEAGLKYNIPTTGTSAHAFTLAFPTEKEAFAAQAKALGAGTTFLVDTYDIPTGIRNAVETVGAENLRGIRIDSGDLKDETNKARALLDELGAYNAKIVLSSDMDEYSISELVDAGAPVDIVGAGTRVVTGSGHPTAGMVFKLVEREGDNGEMISVSKKADGKGSNGGHKTAYREYDENGVIVREFFVKDSNVNLLNGKNVKKITQTLFDGDVMNSDALDLENARSLHKQLVQELPESARLISAGDSMFVVEELS